MFKRHRFPVGIILLCDRWYCKYGILYRDLREMMQEHGVEDRILKQAILCCLHEAR